MCLSSAQDISSRRRWELQRTCVHKRVWGSGADIGGKSGGHAATAIGAKFAVRPVFGDLHFDRWQVENLADFFTSSGLVAEIDTTSGAVIERNGDRDVRGFALEQGLAQVAGLAARFAAAVFWPLGFGALESVARWGLAAVGTVFAEALFEFGDSGFELGDFGVVAGFLFVEQIHHQTANRIQPAFIEGALDRRSKRLFGEMHGA
jgi:hypothetical protein